MAAVENYESSLVSVDVATLRFDRVRRVVEIAAAVRQIPPFEGRLALPGVLLGRGERLTEAGRRAITGKLGARPADIAGMGQVQMFDEPLRDPRGPTLSVALWAVLQSPAPLDGVEWATFDQVPELAFDHNRIIAAVRDELARKLFVDRNFSKALLGRSFTTPQAAGAVESLKGVDPHRSNLNRLLGSTPGLVKDDRSPRSSGDAAGGRPPLNWVWTQDAG